MPTSNTLTTVSAFNSPPARARPLSRMLINSVCVLILVVANAVIWTWPWAYNVAVLTAGDRSSVTRGLPSVIPLEIVEGDYRPLPRRLLTNPTLERAAIIAMADKLSSDSLLVWHRGGVVLEHYQNGAFEDSRNTSASMQKGVLSLLVGAAIADGSFPGADVPIGGYIAAWSDDPRGEITLKQTLQMSSGLMSFDAQGGIFSERDRFVVGLGYSDLISSQALKSAPGTSFQYLNLNSQLAGMALERATGKHYAEYLSEKLWKPLGGARAYVWPYAASGPTRTYSSLFARAEDWLRIGLLLKDAGQFEGQQVIPRAWIDQMLAPSPHNPNYGMNVWFAKPFTKQRWYETPQPNRGTLTGDAWLDPDIFFLDGAGGQRVYVSRSEDLVIVRLGVTNPDWRDSALPNAIIKWLRNQDSDQTPTVVLARHNGQFLLKR